MIARGGVGLGRVRGGIGMTKKKRMRMFSLFLLLVLGRATPAVPARPPIHWVSGGGTLVAVKGEIFEFEARFFSDVLISNAHWFAQSLESIVGPTGSAAPLGNLEADRVYTIERSILVPYDLPTGVYAGALLIYHHRETGNPSGEVIPETLAIKIYVIEATHNQSSHHR